MFKRVIFIFKVFFVIVLLQSCSTFSDFYHCRIYSKNNDKRDLIVNMVTNPNDYVNILLNSEFYHPERSKYLDLNINKITNILKSISYDSNIFSSNDAFLFDRNNNITSHNIAYFFNNEMIIFNKNVISVDYELINSRWYIVSIQIGNYRIEQLE